MWSLHEHTWPELVRDIRASGFLEEYIYLRGSLVIVIMKCQDFQQSVQRLLDSPVFQKWTDPGAGHARERRGAVRHARAAGGPVPRVEPG